MFDRQIIAVGCVGLYKIDHRRQSSFSRLVCNRYDVSMPAAGAVEGEEIKTCWSLYNTNQGHSGAAL